MLNLLSDQPRFAQCKGLDAGSFIRRASRKPSKTAKNLPSSRHRSSLIRSLSSSILRSSAPNSLLSTCRASSMACFSFLMVYSISARTSRAQAICLSMRQYHFGGLVHVDPLPQNLPSLVGFTFAATYSPTRLPRAWNRTLDNESGPQSTSALRPETNSGGPSRIRTCNLGIMSPSR